MSFGSCTGNNELLVIRIADSFRNTYLELAEKIADAYVAAGLFLVRQLVGGWQKWQRIARRKQRQQIGRQVLRHCDERLCCGRSAAAGLHEWSGSMLFAECFNRGGTVRKTSRYVRDYVAETMAAIVNRRIVVVGR